MSPKKKNILIVAGVVVALILLIITVLPIAMRGKIAEEISRRTGRKTQIRSLTFNPLTMTAKSEGFVMEEEGGGHFVSIGKVSLSLSPMSIFKRALIVSKISVDSPSINIVRNAPNQYNFTTIIDRMKTDDKPKQEKQSRYSINNITIKGGSVDFDDQMTDGGRKHTVRNLEIGVPFISNIPYLIEEYTSPKISAVVNGASFTFAGKMKPLSKSMQTSVRINLDRLNLPELAAYLPQKPPAQLASGELTVDTELLYRVYPNKKPELDIKGIVRLSNIDLNMNNGQPLVKIPLFEANISQMEIFAKLFRFDAIKLDGFELFASRNRQGGWMYDSLIPKNQTKTPQKSKEKNKTKGQPQPSFLISSLTITKSAVHLNDALPQGGFKGSLSEIFLSSENIGNAPNTQGKYDLSLIADGDAKLTAAGEFSLSPVLVKTTTKLSGLQLQKGWPYMARYLTAPIKGELELSGDVNYNADNGLIAEHMALTLQNLSARYGEKDGIDLSLFSFNNASFNQKSNALEIAEVKLEKGNISVSLEPDRRISILSLFKQTSSHAEKEKIERKQKRQPDAKNSSPQFSYRLKQFKTSGLNLAFTDKTRKKIPHLALRDTAISLANLNGPQFTPAQLDFSATFGKRASLKANGAITPAPFSYRGDIQIKRLPIRDFEAYFPENLNVDILRGFLDTTLKTRIAVNNGTTRGGFRGSAAVRSFHSIDTVSEEDLIKWDNLQVGEFRGRLEPFNLNISQIVLNDVYSRVIILKDGTLNLQNLMKKTDSPQPPVSDTTSQNVQSASSEPAAEPSRQEQNGNAKRAINIDSITVQGGTLVFSDYHLPQDFSTTFYNLGGRVSGMSSESSKTADVDLRGNLENHSPLQITGKINPLRGDLFLDLKILFKDIELPRATPYSGTYLGYAIEKGKLMLDLSYHIENKQLTSKNKIFIDQFTFGNKVESKKATSLPVKLGLALLKDSKGEIHLDVPVTGRTDDPQFSVWRLVLKVIQNLLVKAATSPLALLSSVFGSGEDLSSVQFAYGTAALSQQEEQKLDLLAKALMDRPSLKIELQGYVDRERDIEGYRSELLDNKILNEKKLDLARSRKSGRKNLENITKVQPEEYSTYLKAVYKKEKFPKPRNMIGLVKDLPDSEMKKLIITNTVVTEDDLQSLAQRRSEKVMDYLVGKCAIPAERVFLKKDNIYKAPGGNTQPGSKVELNAIAS